jgi:eukaryotic-like serine/threonine-protein kinase
MYDKQKVRGSLEFSLPLLISHSTQLLILCYLLSIMIILCIPKQVTAYTIPPIHASTHTITPAHIVHFLRYENSTYGIKMEYPSNWQIIGTNETENHDNDKGILEFRLSSSTSNPSVDRSILSISIHKLPSQNIIVNLLGFFDKSAPKKIALEAFVLSHMTNLLTKLPNFHLIRSDSGESTLADNTPAHKIVYEFREQGQKNILTKGMDILVVKDDTGYVIRYIAEEPKYLDYLPIVQKMVNSVEITR